NLNDLYAFLTQTVGALNDIRSLEVTPILSSVMRASLSSDQLPILYGRGHLKVRLMCHLGQVRPHASIDFRTWTPLTL
ncbi:hypothetical protein, partial [Paenarthrobacter sp. NPDC091669]|uniref:hypothetical protein n=1 Tax=Paenarthrobacter sp. NPDC091669 TaxID=3364384 RepID=UPI00382D349D